MLVAFVIIIVVITVMVVMATIVGRMFATSLAAVIAFAINNAHDYLLLL